MRDGDTYVVSPGEERPNVSRLDDFLAVATEVGAALPAARHDPLGRRPRLALPVERARPPGRRHLAGHAARRRADRPARSGDRRHVCLDRSRSGRGGASREPCLRNPEPDRRPSWASPRQNPRRCFDSYATAARRCVWPGNIASQASSADPVPASRFDLPGPVLSREQLRARQPTFVAHSLGARARRVSRAMDELVRRGACRSPRRTAPRARSPIISPRLAKVDPDKLGIAFADKDGQVWGAGDCDEPFSIQSISKVFTLALALDRVGAKLWERSGASLRAARSTRSSSSRASAASRATR